MVALYLYRRCLRESRFLLPDGVSIIRHVGGEMASAVWNVSKSDAWEYGRDRRKQRLRKETMDR